MTTTLDPSGFRDKSEVAGTDSAAAVAIFAAAAAAAVIVAGKGCTAL